MDAKEGCLWYSNAGKSVCYAKAGKGGGKRRRMGFDGSGTEDQETFQYWFVDELIAPSTKGDYILQWRWDNEQTPQVKLIGCLERR